MNALNRIIAAGGCPMGLPTGAKSPPPTGFPRLPANELAETVLPSSNVAIRCGNGLLVLDLDIKPGINGREAINAQELILGELPETLTVSTPSGGQHLYFTTPLAIKNGINALGPKSGVDIRSDGGYVVAPPSTLANGSYTVSVDAPIAELPSAWAQYLANPVEPQEGPQERSSDVLVEHVANRQAHLQSVLDKAVEAISECDSGSRNVSLNNNALRVFGLFYGNQDLDFSEDSIEDALSEAGSACGLEGREVRATIRSARRAGERNPKKMVEAPKMVLLPASEAPVDSSPPGLPVDRLVYICDLDRYAMRAASGEWGADSLYRSERQVSHRLLDFGYNYFVPKAQKPGAKEDPGMEPVVAKILREKSYERVKSIAMDPSQPAIFTNENDTYLNVFVPPKVQAVEGPFPRIQALIDYHCDNDPKQVEWLMNWFAWKIQNLGQLTRSSAIITAPQYSGKSTLAKILCEIIGHDNTASLGQSDLSPDVRFNSFRMKLFVVVEEAAHGNSERDLSGHLKELTGASRLSVELKGQERIYVKNRTAWMFLSNDAVPVQIEPGDTRFTVLHTSKPVTEEHREMVRILHTGPNGSWHPDFLPEIQGFFHYLRNAVTNESTAREAIDTSAKGMLQESTMKAPEAFVAALEGGQFATVSVVADPEAYVTLDSVYQLFCHFCEREGYRGKYKKNTFSAEIHKLRPAWRCESRKIVGKSKVTVLSCLSSPTEIQ